LWAFEKIATVERGERHHMWSHDEALAEEPTLAPRNLFGAAAFVEYLTDDARLVLATIRGAVEAGALCVNHAELTSLADGRAVVTDRTTGNAIECRARIVVNAAGPWVEAVWERTGARGGHGLQLTKGIHLVVDHGRLPLRHSVVMQARDKRSVFAVP